MNNYKSCLGTAAEIDRKELPYTILCIDGDKITIELCAQGSKQMFAMLEGMVASIGEEIIHRARTNADSNTPNEKALSVVELVKALNLNARQSNTIIGFMGFIDQIFKEADEALKKLIIMTLITRIELEMKKSDSETEKKEATDEQN